MSGDRSKAATCPGADPDRRATARMGRLLAASDLRHITERQTGRLLEAAQWYVPEPGQDLSPER